jgi:hypothetical protein
VSHEYQYMLDRGGVMSQAIGLARLALQQGDPAKAAKALDECCDELHRKHWEAAEQDGWGPEKIEQLLGGREDKATPSWNDSEDHVVQLIQWSADANRLLLEVAVIDDGTWAAEIEWMLDRYTQINRRSK